MSEHSPGPWSWGWYDDSDLIKEDALCQVNGSEIGFYDEGGARGSDTNVANRALIAKAPELLATLRELQWGSGNIDECSYCGHHEKAGHAPDCRLSALLGSFEPPKEPT